MPQASSLLEALRDHLHAEPSAQAWAHVCAALDAMTDAEARDLGVPYVAEHTTAWPEGLRVAPETWLARPSKDPNPRLATVDTINLHRCDDAVTVDLFANAPLAAAPLKRILGASMEPLAALLRKRGFAKRFPHLYHVTLDRAPHQRDAFSKALKAPGWKALTSVKFRAELSDVSPIYCLSGTNAFANITRLDLRGCGLIGDDCDNWRFVKMRKLTWLDVSDNMGDAAPVAHSAVCKSLVHFDGRNQDPYGAVAYGYFERAAWAFSGSRYTGNLRTLLLSPFELGSTGVHLLADSKRLHDDAKRPYKAWLAQPEAKRSYTLPGVDT